MKDAIRILITENCNANCPNCFNAKHRTHSELSAEQIKDLSEYLHNNGIRIIFIEGGEPTIHTCFSEIMEILQNHFEKIVLFTNALSNNLLSFIPRDSDEIVYNFNFASDDEMFRNKLLLDRLGKRNFMVQITSKTNIDTLIERIKQYLELFRQKERSIIVSLDCTEDVFSNAALLAEKWNRFMTFCVSNYLNVKIDHGFPLCIKEKYNCLTIEIYMRKMSDVGAKKGLYYCDYYRGGLIDSQLQLRFCNNYFEAHIPLTKNNSFISFDRFDAFLRTAHQQKNNSLLSKCKGCRYYIENKCNGTCFGIIK